MKGIIICNGRSSNFEPISLSIPIGMFPIANIPIIEHNLKCLIKSDVINNALYINENDLCYSEYFRSCNDFSYPILYFKNINNNIKLDDIKNFMESDYLIWLDGNHYYDINLSQYISKFLNSKKDALVLTYEVEKPWESDIAYVKNDELMKVEQNPRITSSKSGLVGIYIFSSEIIKNFIKSNNIISFKVLDIVKYIIRKKYKILSLEVNDKCIPMNSFANILECNQYVLNNINQSFSQGKDCLTSKAIIANDVSIGNRCIIKNSKISNSIIMDNCFIDGVDIRDSIVCSYSTITGQGTIKGIFAAKTYFEVNKA